MIARISGINLPENKRIVIALTYIKGIGNSVSKKILKEINISEDKRTKELSEEDLNKIRNCIEKFDLKLEGDLQRLVFGNIKRLKEIGSYRGSRHSKKLPVRGQRTKTNSRSVRGNVRRTTTSGKKPSAQKT